MLASAPVLIAAESASAIDAAEDEIDAAVTMRECLGDEGFDYGEKDGEEFDDDDYLDETVESINVPRLKQGAANHTSLGHGTILAVNGDTQQLLEGHVTRFDNDLNAGKVLFRWKSHTTGQPVKSRWVIADACENIIIRDGSAAGPSSSTEAQAGPSAFDMLE